MSEMVEQVARALADANGYDWNDVDQPWHDKGIPTQEQYRTMARAAIEAMREPNQAKGRIMNEITHAEIARIYRFARDTYYKSRGKVSLRGALLPEACYLMDICERVIGRQNDRPEKSRYYQP